MKNTGGENATISQVKVAGTGFSVSGITTPVTLTPGQSTSFSVTYAPQAAGSASGSVTITSDASNPSLSVALERDRGYSRDVDREPDQLQFRQCAGRYQPEPDGDLEEYRRRKSDDFTGDDFGCGIQLHGTDSAADFDAKSEQHIRSRIRADNGRSRHRHPCADGERIETPLNLALSGTGVTPATLTANPTSLTFTNVTVGQSQSQTETVKNTGGVNATISQVTVAGTGFSISGITTPLTLTPGQSTSFSVTFRRRPRAAPAEVS